ncbi:shikimate dehydrogenase [Aromatoleum evansii]|uniref:Shikimate dehydrogenase (NADP(+)) n=1 Tax=Aromatoleum evansii TaxID=59406 RepID=A0ABZ1AVG9_AROEV|nr:shikimate dehydrogenase [Aromatoleum evansii]
MDRYAVIGNPIGHTKSPLIHTAFAQGSGQSLEYIALEAPSDGFATAAAAFRDAGGRGMNVTAPFKLDAFAWATDLSERAQLAGAVNALKLEGGKVLADNFDGVGLVRDIEQNLGRLMRGKRVLLMGAGGAARGALHPFLAARPAQLVLVNRTVTKAEALAQEFAACGPIVGVGYGDLDHSAFDIVVNATSASLRGELPPVTTDVFAPSSLAYELAYGKGLTPFLRLAQGTGVRNLADGVGMLVEQAAEAFAWWRGVRPETAPMIAQLTVPLA